MESRYSQRQTGFTVIEVLMVLAFAGMVLIVILMAVPELQRNARNNERKRIVFLIASQMEQYYAVNNKYPQNPAEGAVFTNEYLAKSVPASYIFDVKDIGGGHDFLPDYDIMAVQYGHWCNRHGDGDAPTDPIAGPDTNTRQYAIWTQLEKAGPYCLDNHK